MAPATASAWVFRRSGVDALRVISRISMFAGFMSLTELPPSPAAPSGAVLIFAYTGAACALPHNTSEGECNINDRATGFEYYHQLPPYGQNLALRSTDGELSWLCSINATHAGDGHCASHRVVMKRRRLVLVNDDSRQQSCPSEWPTQRCDESVESWLHHEQQEPRL